MHPLEPLTCGEAAPELARGKAEVRARVLQQVDLQVVLALRGHLPGVFERDAQQDSQTRFIGEQVLERVAFRGGCAGLFIGMLFVATAMAAGLLCHGR
jgi:hypothetical protein